MFGFKRLMEEGKKTGRPKSAIGLGRESIAKIIWSS